MKIDVHGLVGIDRHAIRQHDGQGHLEQELNSRTILGTIWMLFPKP